MVSYDAKSLYTNTDVIEVMEDLEGKWNLIEEHTTIDEELFFEILEFCINRNVYFTYNDKTYRQIAGLAMGLSLACTIADFYMTKMFDESVPKLSFKPAFVKKFIDDVISTAPEEKVNEAKTIFNQFDPRQRLEFTSENEKDNKINFLDMTLIHMNNGKIKTNWYSKETTSSRMMNFLSAHPKKMKENMATELVNRVMSLSDPIFKPTNKNRIETILKKNNYPDRVIKRAFEVYKAKQAKKHETDTTPTPQNDPENKPIYRSMPYVPNLTQAVNKQLKKANPLLTIAPTHIKKLGNSFTKTKTKIPKEERTDAIYRIDCKTKLCPEPFYLGETGRTPKKRGSEHKTDYNNRHTPGNKTALVNHTIAYPGHEPKLESKDIKILDREKNEFKRKMMEACYINMYDSKANNYKRDARRMNENYSNIINIYKNINNS